MYKQLLSNCKRKIFSYSGGMEQQKTWWNTPTREQKISAYCDLNEIENVAVWLDYAQFVLSLPESITHLNAWNTQDFLATGIWQLIRGEIDDETFFQIGDITSMMKIKQTRPFLESFSILQTEVHPNSCFVIDEAAKIVFIHQYWQEAYDLLIKSIENKKSKVYIIQL